MPYNVLAWRAGAILRRIHSLERPIGVEVGVFMGQLSQVLLDRHRGLHLYMVDNWLGKEQQPADYRASEDFHSKLSAKRQAAYQKAAINNTRPYLYRRTVFELPSVVAATHFEEGQCDFVFLDADHTYGAVTQDITAWWPKVKVGGWLCGHDYGGWVCSGPEKKTKNFFGVTQAVDEAAVVLGVELVHDKDATWFLTKG